MNSNNSAISIVAGVLQIVFSVFLILFAGVLMLIFGIAEGLAEGLGGELNGEGLGLINVSRYSLIWFALFSLINGILLLINKVNKVGVCIANFVVLALISVLFLFLQTPLFYLVALIPVVLIVLNIVTLVKVKSNKKEEFSEICF